TFFQVMVMILSVYLGVREEKKKRNDSISYRDAIFTGLKINLIIAILHSSTIFIYYSSQPAELEKLKKSNIEQAIADMKELNLGESVIQDHIKFLDQDITAFNQAKYNFMIILILGLLFCLVITAILRSKTPEELSVKNQS